MYRVVIWRNKQKRQSKKKTIFFTDKKKIDWNMLDCDMNIDIVFLWYGDFHFIPSMAPQIRIFM